MLNRFGKLVLAITAMAPAAAAVGIAGLEASKPHAKWWLAASVILVFLCLGMLYLVKRSVPPEKLTITSCNLADKEVLAFLVAYLLPLFAKDTAGFQAYPISGIFIFCVLLATVYHSESYTFNPMLSMAGYHFFECELPSKTKVLVLSSRAILPAPTDLHVAALSPYIFIEVPPSDSQK